MGLLGIQGWRSVLEGKLGIRCTKKRGGHPRPVVSVYGHLTNRDQAQRTGLGILVRVQDSFDAHDLWWLSRARERS